MEFIKNNWKNILKYIIIYILFVLAYETFFHFLTLGDSLNSYMFSHALVRGEIIYKDFNTITTPLYAIIMSLGLHIFDSYLDKILKDKVYLFLSIAFLFVFQIFLMTYNFLCLLLIVIICYLEKYNFSKDYLIGFIIGLCILSKFTIGIFLIIPMIIICFKKKNKLLKRFIGILIPCFIFLIYLLIRGNLYNFINLCFLGLFDFNNKNSNLYNSIFFLSIILFIISLIFIIKKNKLKYNYYIPVTFMFVYPLFDYHHLSYFAFFIILMLFDYYKVIKSKFIYYISIILLSGVFIFWIVLSLDNNSVECTGIKHYEKYYMPYNMCFNWKNYNSFLSKYCINKCLLLSPYSVVYDVTKDNKITYYNILFYGNLGYNGNSMIFNDISKNNYDCFIIDDDIYNNNQYDLEVVKYIKDKYKKIDRYGLFTIYYKE